MPLSLKQRDDSTAGPTPLPAIAATSDMAAAEKPNGRCRTNSRRGVTDPNSFSYPPVQAVHRAFDVLRAVNRMRIASVNRIHDETGIPKSTVVRMLETLMAEGYMARDNMCGGYRLTHRVSELAIGYEGISEIIEVSRPFAIDLTRRLKWPIGLGVIDDDAIAIQFWTGTISPWAHTNTVLGLRPDLLTSAMGRAYLAFCTDNEREQHLERFRADTERRFDADEERSFLHLLEQARDRGYAVRDPRTPPFRTITLGLPIFEGDRVLAVISISIFKTAIPQSEMTERIIQPLKTTICKIENAFAFLHTDTAGADDHWDEFDVSF